MSEQRAVPSPSRVFQVAFFGALFGIGWVFGRTWYMIVHAVWGVGYFLRVVKYGYLKGAKVKPKPLKQKLLESPEQLDRDIDAFKKSPDEHADLANFIGSYGAFPIVPDEPAEPWNGSFPISDGRATVS